ncbi:MAG: hypothetical protein M3Z35_13980 [Nitrospirota bacterium]|nr:hypothetical protein [Nitrospirota bacterium]
MVNDHTDLDKSNEDLAKEEERYRDEVSRGGHGAHRPCEKFPIEEAREQGVAPDTEMESATKKPRRSDQGQSSVGTWPI